MIYGFIFWLFFVGIVVASLQDLKRREVDDWLNLFLVIASFTFIFFRAFLENDSSLLFQAGFSFVILFILMNMFYYGRVFAGGDAKLLFAMTVFFIGINFIETLINIAIFVLLLMFSGSIYGLIYSFVLYFGDFKKINERIGKEFGSFGIHILLLTGVVLVGLSFISYYFLILSIFIFVFPLLYVFAKGLEEVSMIRTISGKELREGDWLVEDVNFNGRTIVANWEGLTLEDLDLLKGVKKVKIKEGLPFVPAFLIAFLIYVFFRDIIIGFI